MSSSIPSLDQRRAKHAWDAVQEIVQKHVRKENGKRTPDSQAKKYGTHARKLPTRIMASGLGQALAFLYAKGYTPELLQQLNDWVLDKWPNPSSTRPRPAENALIEKIITPPQGAVYLRRVTAEALAYLQWLIRFAEAEGLMDANGD